MPAASDAIAVGTNGMPCRAQNSLLSHLSATIAALATLPTMRRRASSERRSRSAASAETSSSRHGMTRSGLLAVDDGFHPREERVRLRGCLWRDVHGIELIERRLVGDARRGDEAHAVAAAGQRLQHVLADHRARRT
jgi:hypothetical protein